MINIISNYQKALKFLAIALGLIFALSAICFVITLNLTSSGISFLNQFSNNWLIIIYKLHSNSMIEDIDPLRSRSLYDILILLCFAAICFFLFKIEKRKRRIFYLLSSILLITGIIIFLLTQLAGRSSFMAAGLIISIIFMYKSATVAGITGLLANSFLLVGDFTVGKQSGIIPLLFGTGYLLLIIWFFMIAFLIFRRDAS